MNAMTNATISVSFRPKGAVVGSKLKERGDVIAAFENHLVSGFGLARDLAGVIAPEAYTAYEQAYGLLPANAGVLATQARTQAGQTWLEGRVAHWQARFAAEKAAQVPLPPPALNHTPVPAGPTSRFLPPEAEAEIVLRLRWLVGQRAFERNTLFEEDMAEMRSIVTNVRAEGANALHVPYADGTPGAGYLVYLLRASKGDGPSLFFRWSDAEGALADEPAFRERKARAWTASELPIRLTAPRQQEAGGQTRPPKPKLSRAELDKRVAGNRAARLAAQPAKGKSGGGGGKKKGKKGK